MMSHPLMFKRMSTRTTIGADFGRHDLLHWLELPSHFYILPGSLKAACFARAVSCNFEFVFATLCLAALHANPSIGKCLEPCLGNFDTAVSTGPSFNIGVRHGLTSRR